MFSVDPGAFETCHVAINMPATQGSVYSDAQGSYPASYAVDGSHETDFVYNSCAHSNVEINPWWMVDLSIPLTITGVFFTNRRISCT